MHSKEKFIMAGGCATRVSDTEKGDRAIVLLHGYLESLNIWDEFIPLLSPHARVIAIDLPGHGISEIKGEVHEMSLMADVVYGAMQTLGVRQALIVGHSMGGYVALEFIKRHPEAATGIVLFHSGPDADTQEKKNDRQREIDIILAGKKELIAHSFPHVGFAPQNRRRLADEIEDLTEQIILTEDEGIVAVLHGLSARQDNNLTLQQSPVPQLAIMGRHDHYITAEAAEAMAAAHPQMHLQWLEDSAHMGFIEEPARSAEILLSFLDRVCPAPN